MLVSVNQHALNTIRLLPALDALEAAFDNQLELESEFPDLFAGRPWRVDPPGVAEPDYALQRFPPEPSANPLGVALVDLNVWAVNRDGQTGPLADPVDWLPRLGRDWEPNRLVCRGGGYLVNPTVMIWAGGPRATHFQPDELTHALAGLTHRETVLHLIMNARSPLLPNAVELASWEGDRRVTPGWRTLLKAVSDARTVLTDSWAAFEMAIGYRRPVLLARRDLAKWTCPHAGQPACPPWRSLDELSAYAVERAWEDLTSAANP